MGPGEGRRATASVEKSFRGGENFQGGAKEFSGGMEMTWGPEEMPEDPELVLQGSDPLP